MRRVFAPEFEDVYLGVEKRGVPGEAELAEFMEALKSYRVRGVAVGSHDGANLESIPLDGSLERFQRRARGRPCRRDADAGGLSNVFLEFGQYVLAREKHPIILLPACP